MVKKLHLGVAVMGQYEIRLNGEPVCVSSVPKCGYSAKTLREMLAAGYRYYVNGKMERKVEAA